jgi:hypothetical protein
MDAVAGPRVTVTTEKAQGLQFQIAISEYRSDMARVSKEKENY